MVTTLYKGSIVVTEDNQIQENIPFTDDIDARDTFLNLCRAYLPRLDYRNSAWVTMAFQQGKVNFHNGIITVSRFLR